jgi:hydroxymethylglutaryl-CoA lyase
MARPERIRIVEVGPRDGLQNEAGTVATATKVELIQRLAATGLDAVEATAFVRPDRVPQMADAAEVLAQLEPSAGVRYPVLVPNLTGLERALASGASEIAVFSAASETFNRRNTNAGIQESLDRFAPVLEAATEAGVPVRGYVSCALGCPYEGEVAATAVAGVATALHRMGCYEISLGDTIGAGTPLAARSMLEAVATEVPIDALALHFHDTRGQALANIYACLDLGVATLDASVAGLGGCPYAEGATGNVATEDLVYMLHGMGIVTGVDLDQLVEVGLWICAALEREPASRLGQIARRQRG